MNNWCFFTLSVLVYAMTFSQEKDKVFFTNGFKIQNVTDSSAVFWVRLCKFPKAVPIHHKQKEAPFRYPLDFDNTKPVNKMDGAVEGSFGQVKVTLFNDEQKFSTKWKYVSPYRDYILMEEINGLSANTKYKVVIGGRKNKNSETTEIEGSFNTTPASDKIVAVSFTSSTCQYFWDYDDPVRGFKAYDNMLKLNPLFHCQTGDYVYYDKPGPMAYTIELARHKWNAINAWPSLVDFYTQVPLFLQKDDHDILKDDATPNSLPLGELTFVDALDIWHEQTPHNEKPYKSLRWGKDLEVWFVEAREYRSDNKEEDGESKSIYGKEQKLWLKNAIKNSNATFKILMSPTPVVGPDRTKGKIDNHSNKSYETEGNWLRNFLSSQKNTFVVNGDRHWQYVSKDMETGLLEFSQGPTSDEHAQGWNPDDIRPEHKFLRVKGGFLYVSVNRKKNIPIINFRHYDVNGNIVNEEIIKAE